MLICEGAVSFFHPTVQQVTMSLANTRAKISVGNSGTALPTASGSTTSKPRHCDDDTYYPGKFDLGPLTFGGKIRRQIESDVAGAEVSAADLAN